MNLIMLGPPGSGKGTQAVRLAKELNVTHLSTGDVLREAVKQGTELGKKAEGFMSRGELVPDDLIIGLIEAKVEGKELTKGFILDGFPRTVPQADSLDEMLTKHSMSISKAILLDVGDETIITRLKKRAEIEGRADDTEDVIRRRLEVYREQTQPIVQFYKSKSVLAKVQGEDTPDNVFTAVRNAAK
ncbi:MAG: adenylate kinase [Candidatus Zixiibacteriota bacterium]|nr:MAG: adenylate kinase [candidate division Zixibacteria bacterium]